MYIPVVQRELDEFREIVWNHNRGRKQRDKELPTGIPAHIYDNPEHYGGSECGTAVTEAMLAEVARATQILENDHDFLIPELRDICEEVLPDPESVKAVDAPTVYLDLKEAVYEALAKDC